MSCHVRPLAEGGQGLRDAVQAKPGAKRTRWARGKGKRGGPAQFSKARTAFYLFFFFVASVSKALLHLYGALVRYKCEHSVTECACRELTPPTVPNTPNAPLLAIPSPLSLTGRARGRR